MTLTSLNWNGNMAPPSCWASPEQHFEAAIAQPWYRLITHVNATLVNATFDFYRQQEIIPVLMPITVGSISSPMGLGSDSLPVEIELFGEPTFLADSMQFQLEFFLRHGIEGAFYIMPTFRGEDPDVTHLNQFFHSEAEIVGGLDDVIVLVENYLRSLTIAMCATPLVDNISQVAGGVAHLEYFQSLSEFPRITFAESMKFLGDEYFTRSPEGIPLITRLGEKKLIDHFGVVWLTHFPRLIAPFYQAKSTNGLTVECADLLIGIGETVGCGERHATGEDVRLGLEEHQVPVAEYEWYVQMKNKYPLRTAGFGLGLERFLLWVLQHNDIRDLHVMPRLKNTKSWL